MVQYLHLRILEFPLTYPISIVNFRDGVYDHEPNIYRISFPYYPTMTSFILWFFNEAMEIIMFNRYIRYIDYHKNIGHFPQLLNKPKEMGTRCFPMVSPESRHLIILDTSHSATWKSWVIIFSHACGEDSPAQFPSITWKFLKIVPKSS